MKTATYRRMDGKDFTIEYDEAAPCRVCNEPVRAASMGGTDVCPACDCGLCRYGCGAKMFILREELDSGRSLQAWRDHMRWHHEQQPVLADAGEGTDR